MAGKTLYDKVWDAHLVGRRKDGNSLIYIDLQLLHEVTSPQAFEGLTLNGRPLWRVGANLATPDHNVPTDRRAMGLDGITDEVALEQVITLDKNCKAFGVEQFDILDRRPWICAGFARDVREGTGLTNLRERLVTLYGDASALTLPPSGQPATVTISIPIDAVTAFLTAHSGEFAVPGRRAPHV